MFNNYFKVALRNLLRKKGFSVINILGLSIGIACCLLILLYVQDEFSFDRHHGKADRIYRMALDRIYPDHVSHYAVIPAGFSEVVAQDIPEVEQTSRLMKSFQDVVVRNGDDIFRESKVMFADSNLFELFDIPFQVGDERTALRQPNAVILTASTAKRYFGEQEVLGKQLTTDFGEVVVSGVVEDLPENSHFTFDLLLSTGIVNFLREPNYLSFSVYTYLLLQDGTNPDQVEAKLPQLVEQYASGQIQARMNISFDEYVKAGNGYHYFLQPLTDIHLHSQLEGEARPNGNIAYVYLFMAIAIFILLLACINFMNLATARSAERAREVGIRKVLGSVRKQLIGQFLMESSILALLGLFGAIALVRISLPFFNELASKNLVLDLGGQLWIIPSMFAFAILVGVFAGSYPAFVLSSFLPAGVLKGNFKTSNKGLFLRNGLVVFQFAISIFLIAGTLLVYRQLRYVQEKNLGYKKDHVMVLDRAGGLGEKAESFRQNLLQHPDIQSVGSSSALPGGYYFGFVLQERPGAEVLTMKAMTIDDNFLPTLSLEMLEGRSFAPEFNDTLSLILNESAVNKLGIKDPIGKTLINPQANGEGVNFKVVGVVKDFHFESLHQEIGSLAILSTENFGGPGNVLSLRFSTQNLDEVIAYVGEKWREFNPEQPFSYSFLDQDLATMYEAEERVRRLSTAFTGLAILIACIGLFGLSAFTAQQRTKEIGIRKVMGANVRQLVFMLSRHFTILVLCAFVIGSLAIWYAASEWLQDFAYRIKVYQQLDVFLMSGGIALLVAWLTISYQSIKAALRNPIDALRHE